MPVNYITYSRAYTNILRHIALQGTKEYNQSQSGGWECQLKRMGTNRLSSPILLTSSISKIMSTSYLVQTFIKIVVQLQFKNRV